MAGKHTDPDWDDNDELDKIPGENTGVEDYVTHTQPDYDFTDREVRTDGGLQQKQDGSDVFGTLDGARQGNMGPREIAGALGYDSIDEMNCDLEQYNDKFTAEDFKEDQSIETSASVQGALSALDDFPDYDITSSLETQNGEIIQTFEVERAENSYGPVGI